MGFTLIELLAVLVIVGIVAGVAWPNLNNLTATRATMAGRQLQRDLTFARQHALATGTVCWVVVSTGSGTWSVLAEDPNNPGRVNATVMNDLATGNPYTVSLNTVEFSGVSMTACNFGGNTEVGFNWLGQPLVVGGGLMTAQGSVTFTGGRRVTVEAGTGHIRYIP